MRPDRGQRAVHDRTAPASHASRFTGRSLKSSRPRPTVRGSRVGRAARRRDSAACDVLLRHADGHTDVERRRRPQRAVGLRAARTRHHHGDVRTGDRDPSCAPSVGSRSRGCASMWRRSGYSGGSACVLLRSFTGPELPPASPQWDPVWRSLKTGVDQSANGCAAVIAREDRPTVGYCDKVARTRE